MRIAVIASKITPVTSDLVKELAVRGADARIVCPERQLTDLTKIRIEDDLYVLKSVGHLGLGLAGALHWAGANLLNPYPAVALVKNKVAVTQVLQTAGVPVPETYTTTDPEMLLPILERFPLIAKPFDGSRSDGIEIIRTAAELMNATHGEFLMVQRYCEPDQPNCFIKAYLLDRRIFMFKRHWSQSDRRNKDFEPIGVPKNLEVIVRDCAKVLKLRLFGIDLVISGGKPYVVDVQEFGGFVGVPDAPSLLADHIVPQLKSILSDRAATGHVADAQG